MRPLSLIAALFFSLLSVIPCQAQSAAEIYFEESAEDTWTPDSQYVDVWKIDAPNTSEHTGLLGKVYMQQRYLNLGIDDPEIRRVDKSLQGFDSFINLPVMTLDTSIQLDFDLFFSYSNIGMKGSANTGPPLDTLLAVNGKSENYALGTSIYLTQAERWRPFVQLGVEYNRTDFDLTVQDAVSTFAGNFVDSQTDLLLNTGFEYDIFDVLGYRMTINCETSGSFRDSLLSNELILWPHEKIFIRGGLATSLEGGGIGFALGGGLTF